MLLAPKFFEAAPNTSHVGLLTAWLLAWWAPRNFFLGNSLVVTFFQLASFFFPRLKPAARLDSTDAESASQSPTVSADQQAQQSQMQQHQQYLGDVTQGLPEFEELDLKDITPPG